VSKPVSGASGNPQTTSEQGPTDEAMKRDPKEDPESKRKNVEKLGDKPMGPEDSQ